VLSSRLHCAFNLRWDGFTRWWILATATGAAWREIESIPEYVSESVEHRLLNRAKTTCLLTGSVAAPRRRSQRGKMT
jgi:hypothetical protein